MKRKKKKKASYNDPPMTAILEKAGVELAKEISIKLRCKKCGAKWKTKTHDGGRLDSGFHVCPRCEGNKCGEASDE